MAATYEAIVPNINSAKFSINPTPINSKTVLEVIVAEISVLLEPEKFFLSEIYSGEV